jgi:hypothetical protein
MIIPQVTQQYGLKNVLITYQWLPPAISEFSLSLTGKKTNCFVGRFNDSRLDVRSSAVI